MRAQASKLQGLTSPSIRKAAVDPVAPLRLSGAMTVREVITAKLGEAFAPASLDVIDESDRHVGHAGYRAGGETHFRIHIVSEAFRGKSRLERHRMIYNTLADELKAGVHALAIEATTPSERAA